MNDDERMVRDRLAAAGFPASEEEIAAFVALYPAIRGMVEMVYQAVPERDVAPALHYDPVIRDGAANLVS